MKRYFAYFWGMSLCFAAMSGCGQTESLDNGVTEGETFSFAQASGENGGGAETLTEDISEIEVMFWTLDTIPKDINEVEDAINAITVEKIQTEVHLNILESGNYVQQLNLMLAGDETIDLLVTQPGGASHFNSMVSQNQLTDLTRLLVEYAPELLKTVPESWLKGTSVDGKIYAVPSLGDKATPLGFACRKDIFEKTGFSASQIKTAKDLDALFEKVKTIEPEMMPLAAARNSLTTPYLIDTDGNFIKYDALGDSGNALIGLMPQDNGQIKNNFAREEFIYTCELFKDWYDKGYLYKDSANYADNVKTLVASGNCFGFFGAFGVGAEVSESIICDNEMMIIPLDDAPLLDTSVFRKFTWAVPSTSKEPEAAVRFLNLMYTDETILNLLCWGIDGVHYQVLDDGTIDFLDDEDNASCGYYIGDATAIIGNGFLAKVRNGQDPGMRKEAEEINFNASVSQYNGFALNTSGLENEVAALTNAVEEFRPSLVCGLYTESYYNDFIKKLSEVGIEKYISEMQKQLDNWEEN